MERNASDVFPRVIDFIIIKGDTNRKTILRQSTRIGTEFDPLIFALKINFSTFSIFGEFDFSQFREKASTISNLSDLDLQFSRYILFKTEFDYYFSDIVGECQQWISTCCYINWKENSL